MFGSALMFILGIIGVSKFNNVCLEEENIHVSIMVELDIWNLYSHTFQERTSNLGVSRLYLQIRRKRRMPLKQAKL